MSTEATTKKIIQFLRDDWKCPDSISARTTLQDNLGFFGDDLGDFLDEYAARFHVDMARYHWYFHTGEEGFNVGALFFKPPNKKVEQIPITVEMLCEFADSGTWSVEYPPHSISEHRIDIWIGPVLLLALLSAILVWIALQ